MVGSEIAYAVTEDDLLRRQGLLEGLPAPSRAAGVLRVLRSNASQMRTIVIDDDATGSQTVRDVALLFSFDLGELVRALEKPGSAAFVLTNSRSLDAREAAIRNREIGESLPVLERRVGGPVRVVSRSDSTLRGHFVPELEALDDARRRATGRSYDAVIFAPGYFEAGRVTIEQTHWARVGGVYVPVGETEFARDADFSYRNSNLSAFIAERLESAETWGSAGAESTEARIGTLDLRDIRVGGIGRAKAVLSSGWASVGFVVVDGTAYADYEVVACAASELEREGRRFLYRTGPSFVTALLGQDPPDPLSQVDVAGGEARGGLVVVGSHVQLTNAQLAHAREHHEFVVAEVDVPAVMNPETRDAHVAEIAQCVVRGLAIGDVLLVTTRSVVREPANGLGVARRVSDALVEIVGALVDDPPRWFVAKGGITSHDLAERALGIRSAVVVGQLERGAISVLFPKDSLGATAGIPYVIFAGNVGTEESLTRVVKRLGGEVSA